MAIKHLTRVLGNTEIADSPFRSLTDVETYLKSIHTKLSEVDGLLRQYQMQFSRQEKTTAAEIEFTVNPDESPKKRGGGQTIKLDKIDKIVVPKLDSLRKNFTVVDELAEQVDQLKVLYNSVSVNFRSVRGANEVLKNIKAMQSVAEKKMQAALQFLNSVGEKYVPDNFRKLVESAIGVISPSLEFKDHQTFVYGYETKDENLAFSVYIQLRGLLDDDGNQYPQFYMVFSCVLKATDTKGKVEPLYYVTVMHDFTTPGKFTPGKQVSNASEAVSALGLLMELENVNTAIGVIPHGLDPAKIRKTNLSVGEKVYKVHVDANSITFELLKGESKASAESAAAELYKDMQGLLSHIKKPNLKARIFEKDGRWSIRFMLTNMAREDQVSIDDLNFLAEHFELDDEKLRRITRIING